MDIGQTLRSIPLMKNVSPATVAALLPATTIKILGRGRHLFFERDTEKQMFFLVSGSAALYKQSDSHERKIIFICAPGELLNEIAMDGRDSTVNCEILAPSQVLCIEREPFLAACSRDPALSAGVMDLMCLKIRRLYRQIKNTTGNTRSDRKIAAKLWKLARDHGVSCPEGTMIDFHMTITFLAEFMGLTRETVSRQVGILSEKGLIIVSNNRFIIPDQSKLRAYYCKK